MRILKSEDAKLSNWEVLHHLKSQIPTNPDQEKLSQQIIHYLVNETSASLETLTKEDMEMCIQKLGQFELTTEEKLQIVNLMPTSLVEVHMIIADCANRLTENETLDILNIVQEYLKPIFLHMQNPEEEDGETGEREGEMQEEGEQEEEIAAGTIDLGF